MQVARLDVADMGLMASFLSTNQDLYIPAKMLHEGGRTLAEELMHDLRHLHLGHPRTSDGPMVLERVWQAMQKQALTL